MKNIPGYEGQYAATLCGKIWSCKRNRFLAQAANKSNYLVVNLGKGNTQYVHRMVCLTYFGYSNLTVNHINGNKRDNRISNLEYVAYSDNHKHAYETGLRAPTKLDKDIIECIIKLREEGASYVNIAKTIGCSISSAWRYCK